MRLRVLLWFLLTAAGALVIALPDDDQRVITFSAEHGPSAADAVGIALLLAGFAIPLQAVAAGRRTIARSLHARPALLATCAFLAGLGLGLLTAGLFTDFWWWWLVGAAILQAFWLLLWKLSGHPSSM